MNNGFAVGSLIPANLNNADSNNPDKILQSIRDSLERLSTRLAPNPQFIDVPFDSADQGFETIITNINGSYNGFLLALTRGEVDITFGNGSRINPDLHAYGGMNPTNVNFPPRHDNAITFRVPLSSNVPAVGHIYILSY